MTSGPWMGSRQKNTGFRGCQDLTFNSTGGLGGGITNKVQADNVIVALHSVELDGEAAGVASLIWKLSSESDSREADKSWRLLSNARKEVGFLRKMSAN
jgi:hypothetical protein